MAMITIVTIVSVNDAEASLTVYYSVHISSTMCTPLPSN